MDIMDVGTRNLGIGLVILMVVNIILGSLGAVFEKKFSLKRLGKGAAKGFIVGGCYLATYFVGYPNPDIIAVNIGDIEANITTALYLTVLAGYIHYGKQVVEKFAVIVKGASITEKDVSADPVE